MKLRIIVFLLATLLISCSQVSTPVRVNEPAATLVKAPTFTAVATPTLVTTPTSETTSLAKEGSKECQQIYQEADYPSHLEGTLIYGKKDVFAENRFNEIYAFQFPSLKETTFLHQNGNSSYYYPEISPNGKFLAVLRGSNPAQIDAIEIYSADSELATSIPLNRDNLVTFYGWAGNENLVFNQYDESTKLIVINPFTGVKNIVPVRNDNNVRIRAFDPAARIFALGYEDSTDPRVIDSTILWDSSNDTTLRSFSPQENNPDEIRWSHDGNSIAITNRRAINLLNNQGETIKTFDLSNEDIIVWNIQWSLDDSSIFFFAWDRDLANSLAYDQTYDHADSFLYKIDLANGDLKRFCVTSLIYESGYSDNFNKTYWRAVSPEYFITENYTEYNNADKVFRYDVLLVDSQNNKATKLGKQLDLVGWMTNTP